MTQEVKAAQARRKCLKPYRLFSPVTLDLSLENYFTADVLSHLRVLDSLRTEADAVGQSRAPGFK